MMLTEELMYQPDGSLLSNNTWFYKIPCTKTIPLDFRVALHYSERFRNIPGDPLNYAAVLKSKGVGEPGLMLATSVFFAVKHAILAARRDRGKSNWFEMPAPATVVRVHQYCEVTPADLML